MKLVPKRFRYSAIFCTYNRDKYLYEAMKSIADQKYDPFLYEILVVNNNSTDSTEELCERFEKDFPEINFRYIVETNQGLSYARNRGIKESKGDILVFVDDDAVAFDDYFGAIDRFMATHPNILACGGPIYPKYEVEKPSWLSPYTEELIGGALYFGDQDRLFPDGKFPGGGNSAFRKEVFDIFGLFNVELGRKGNNLLGAEEKDLFDRMTKADEQIYYVPQMGIFHFIPAKKLTNEYFNNLTYSVGKSERIRTKSVSSEAYRKRLWAESVKWAGSIALCIGYTLKLKPSKGIKLLQFRKNVTKGLLGM